MIEFCNIGVRYGTQEVLANVNFRVNKGERVQADIDRVIQLKIFLSCHAIGECHPIRFDRRALERVQDTLAGATRGSMKQKAGMRRFAQDAPPRHQRRRIHRPRGYRSRHPAPEARRKNPAPEDRARRRRDSPALSRRSGIASPGHDERTPARTCTAWGSLPRGRRGWPAAVARQD